MVSYGTGVHEGLCNDQQHSIHIIRRLHIKNKLGVLDDVDPEPQWEAVERIEVQKGISKGSSYSAERYSTSYCISLLCPPSKTSSSPYGLVPCTCILLLLSRQRCLSLCKL